MNSKYSKDMQNNTKKKYWINVMLFGLLYLVVLPNTGNLFIAICQVLTLSILFPPMLFGLLFSNEIKEGKLNFIQYIHKLWHKVGILLIIEHITKLLKFNNQYQKKKIVAMLVRIANRGQEGEAELKKIYKITKSFCPEDDKLEFNENTVLYQKIKQSYKQYSLHNG